MAKRSLAELVEEQNRLAKAKASQRPYAVVRVLVASRYSGPDLKAVRANVGDVIAVAGNGYVDDLIRQGLVEPTIVEPEPEGNSGDTGADLTIAELRKLAKLAGINSHGMTKAALVEALFGEPSPEDDSEEEPEDTGDSAS